ncbi:MAG: zinc-dependent alcohol dehydrogenase family protein [Hyphomicrobium sp.]
MKAFQLKNAFGIDNLALEDVAQPGPEPGQALVRMRAWSLNYRDLLVVRGLYKPRLQFPFQMISDGAGEVVAVGEGVTRVKSGDRVAGAFMQKWIEGGPDDVKSASALGGDIPGLAAEYVVLDAEGLVHVPAGLSYEEAATLPCAALTAWNALVTAGKLTAGDVILVQGTGGVSIFALQFAKMLGARVIATSSSDAKLERLKALGASDLINYKSTPDWGRRARDLTGGRGVDHVVEVGGAGTLAQSLAAVRTGGRVSMIGVLSSGDGEAMPIFPILMKAVTVQGIFVGSREMFEAMNRAIGANGLKPVIDAKTFAFSDFPDALRYMESGAHFGKIVLRG